MSEDVEITEFDVIFLFRYFFARGNASVNALVSTGAFFVSNTKWKGHKKTARMGRFFEILM